MSTLFPKTISYISYNAGGSEGGYDEAGDWVPGASETLTFEGSVQPADGEDFDSLAVGRRNKGMVKVYSSTRLKISNPKTKTAGDDVIFKDKLWEVIEEGINDNNLLPHYKYMAQYNGEYTP